MNPAGIIILQAALIPVMEAAASAAIAIDKFELANAANNILKDMGGAGGPFYTAFMVFAFLSGLALIFAGIRGLTKRETPPLGAIVAILIGTILIGLKPFLDMFTMSMFNSMTSDLVSDVGDGGDKLLFTSRAFVNFSVFAIQVVGYCAVYRGLKTLADISLTHQRQPQQMRAAFIFLFAGVLCINIVWTIKTIVVTASGASEIASSGNGVSIREWYNKILGHLDKI